MSFRMKIMMALLVWVLAFPQANVMADDSKMTHIFVQNMEPGMPEPISGDIWLVGTRYLRAEFAPDSKPKQRFLVIVNQPDLYRIDPNSNTGDHRIEKRPEEEWGWPLFPPHLPRELSKCMLGGERKFFRERNAQQIPDVEMDGRSYEAQMLKIEGTEITMLSDKTSGILALISAKSGKNIYKMKYKVYETGLEPDMNLFKVPMGVKIFETEKLPAQ